MIKKLLVLGSLFIAMLPAVQTGWAATCVSTGTGNWETATTWSCGRVPTCNDSVVIQAGHTVTITSQLDYTGCGGPMQLTIAGTLTFQTGKKIDMACGSHVYIVPGGQITGGGGGGSSNLINICNATVWTAGSGTASGPDCFPITDPRCSAFLPIELLYFKASICNKDVCLNWATATETNNNYFTVEKTQDGFNIVTVGHVPGSGTTSIMHTYSLIDDNPFHGTSYYRLKQTDYDGKFSYSGWVAVDYEFSIYPNPNNGDVFYIDTPPSYIGGPVTVDVYDVTGRKIHTEHVPVAGIVIEVRTGKIANGMYQVSLSNAAGAQRSYRQKLVVQ